MAVKVVKMVDGRNIINIRMSQEEDSSSRCICDYVEWELENKTDFDQHV